MRRTIIPQIVYHELYRHYYYNRRSSVDLLSDKREIVNNPRGYIIYYIGRLPTLSEMYCAVVTNSLTTRRFIY